MHSLCINPKTQENNINSICHKDIKFDSFYGTYQMQYTSVFFVWGSVNGQHNCRCICINICMKWTSTHPRVTCHRCKGCGVRRAPTALSLEPYVIASVHIFGWYLHKFCSKAVPCYRRYGKISSSRSWMPVVRFIVHALQLHMLYIIHGTFMHTEEGKSRGWTTCRHFDKMKQETKNNWEGHGVLSSYSQVSIRRHSQMQISPPSILTLHMILYSWK